MREEGSTKSFRSQHFLEGINSTHKKRKWMWSVFDWRSSEAGMKTAVPASFCQKFFLQSPLQVYGVSIQISSREHSTSMATHQIGEIRSSLVQREDGRIDVKRLKNQLQKRGYILEGIGSRLPELDSEGWSLTAYSEPIFFQVKNAGKLLTDCCFQACCKRIVTYVTTVLQLYTDAMLHFRDMSGRISYEPSCFRSGWGDCQTRPLLQSKLILRCNLMQDCSHESCISFATCWLVRLLSAHCLRNFKLSNDCRWT